MKEPFVHLHTHTAFSLLDGMIRTGDLIAGTRELGMDAVAITDHGNTFGMIEFFREAVSQGVKPILGCEMYLSGCPKEIKEKAVLDSIYHLVLLAENQVGLRNILKLVSIGHLEGFYRKPRIDVSDLREYHEGIIALSACLHGQPSRLLLSGETERAADRAGELSEIFGKGNFFIELMDHGLADEREAIPLLVKLARDGDIPLVASNDVHYLRREDHPLHEILLCIQTATHMEDPARISYSTDQMYLKSPGEMTRVLGEFPGAMSNSWEIASRCHASIDFDHLHLPQVETEDGTTLEESLRSACDEGLEKRGLGESSGARERLEYELRVIGEKELAGYFLIVQDLVRFARRKGIPVGSGRGSVGGSLVAYLLEITDIDPLHYGLYFERFLNPHRKGMPDIDIDFGHRGRDDVFRYVSEKYGFDHVAHIATLDSLSPRSAIRDVGRALNLSYGYVDRIAKMVPFHAWRKTLPEIVNSQQELRDLYESQEVVRRLIDAASRLEGLPRHPSIHAAGVVVADAPLTEYVSLQYTSKEEVITQATMRPVEAIGLLKMDLLGLRFLSVIQDTLEQISRTRGIGMTPRDIPLDDPDTYRLLAEGDTMGLFQVESRGMSDLLFRLGPERIEDLVALLSLYRPGPLAGGVVDTYIRRRHGAEEVAYPHPVLEEVLRDTYGVILFQEQVMQVAREFAGYSLAQADVLRRTMSKKLIGELKGEKELFLAQSEELGRDRAVAEEIFDLLSHFGGYGFNKAHSTGYTIEVYRTAYLKAHFFPEYWVSLVNCNLGFTQAITRWLSYGRRRKLTARAPDINRSEARFILDEDGAILAGFNLVKYLGSSGIGAIIGERRRKGKYHSLLDFLKRIDPGAVNRRSVESLVKSGCFDSTGFQRHELLAVADEYVDAAAKANRKADDRQMPLFGENIFTVPPFLHPPKLPPLPLERLLEMEVESMDMYFSAHPMDPFEEILKRNGAHTIAKLLSQAPDYKYLTAGIISGVRFVRTRKRERMGFCRLEDKTEAVEMILFPKFLSSVDIETLAGERKPVLVLGRLELDEGGHRMLAEEITPL